MMHIDENISRNFSILKLLSILMVAFGHFFDDVIPLIWVPVTVGLIIFSFSSGYFTGLKYKDEFDVKKFWAKKFQRLFINLMVINVFLLILFLFQSKSGLWTWQTLVSCLGLSGFLNWFHLKNTSPFGQGMWFFTLLLIFYAVYPLLKKIRQKHWHIFITGFILTAYIFSQIHNVGHALYLTAAGFVTGVYFGRGDISINPKPAMAMSAAALIAMLALNFIFGITRFNFFFILLFSIGFIFSVINIKESRTFYTKIAFLTTCILEIYLLHPYLFLHVTGMLVFDFIISLLIILPVAKILSQVSSRLVLTVLK